MDTPTLTNAELSVLELLWDQGECTARQIREALYPDAAKSQHGTVQRFLQSLQEKGCVLRDDSLPVHRFRAAMSREEFASRQLESLTEKLTGGSLAPLLTQLLDEDKLSRTEIARLRAILDRPAKGRGGRRRG